jgi:hypothetical protein
LNLNKSETNRRGVIINLLVWMPGRQALAGLKKISIL